MDTTNLATQLTSPTHGTSSATRERALVLLGSGVSVDATAAACGVSASAISQLLSLDDFSAAVAEIRFKELQKHNAQDTQYDDIESQLTEKFKQSIPLMMRPMEILKGLQVINAAKRRGASAPESIHDKQTVVSITLPSVILNNFTSSDLTVNLHNQVVKIGDTDLTTMQSGTLLGIHKSAQQEVIQSRVRELTNGTNEPAIASSNSSSANLSKRDPTNI